MIATQRNDHSPHQKATRIEPRRFHPMPPIVASTAVSFFGIYHSRGTVVLTGLAVELVGVTMILVLLIREERRG